MNPADAVALTLPLPLPRSMLPELPALAKSLNDRMHELLKTARASKRTLSL